MRSRDRGGLRTGSNFIKTVIPSSRPMLPTLSHKFLVQMAHLHQLTPEQEQVFLLKFSEHKRYQEIARELGISKEACLKRMGAIYEKFSIQGDTRGKENRLRILLNQQYQQEAPAQLYRELLENDPNALLPIGEKSNYYAWELKDRMDKLLKALKSQPQQHFQNELDPPVPPSQLALEDRQEWLRMLRQKLTSGGSGQNAKAVLREFAAQLPEVVERAAATSKRTELEIATEILDRIASIISQ